MYVSISSISIQFTKQSLNPFSEHKKVLSNVYYQFLLLQNAIKNSFIA